MNAPWTEVLWDWGGKTWRRSKGLFFPWGLSGAAVARLRDPWRKHRCFLMLQP